MMAYYNELDPKAAEWLRELIRNGHIAYGDVDERSIEDVTPDELRGYTQCHFFAGIGGWSLALRLAGWPDDRPVWTGSCPCQSFSAAGKGAGFADERHLWPAWFHLIDQCRPSVVFGEQVGAAIGHGWLDLVQADMEAANYSIGAVCVPAAGVGAPHIRDRLWFVADSNVQQRDRCWVGRSRGWLELAERSTVNELVDAKRTGLEGFGSGHKTEGGRFGEVRPVATASESCRVGDSGSIRRQQFPNGGGSDGTRMDSGGWGQVKSCENVGSPDSASEPGPTNGRWRDADWLLCRDGRWRPVEPGTFPLANGVSERVVKLRGYGNAIVPQVAAEIIKSYMEHTS